MQANRGTAQLGGVVICVKKECGKKALGLTYVVMRPCHVQLCHDGRLVASAHSPNELVPRRCHILMQYDPTKDMTTLLLFLPK